MTTNPMQRKARMYLLLGVLITLIVTGAIIALLGMQLLNIRKQQEAQVNVYVLKEDVKSGQIITKSMVGLKSVDSSLVPQGATSNIDTFMAALTLKDKAGNKVGIDEKGNLYIQKNGTKKQLIKEGNNYYISNNDESKEYIEFQKDPIVAKLDLGANTVLTTGLVSNQGTVESDLRMQEYNMIVLPTSLEVGDYIDVRLQLPNGQDFIVISKKQVEDANADTIWMKLSEDETLTMSSAIVEAYIMTGSKLYAVTYVDAGNQKEAIATYMPNSAVVDLINTDSNITAEAKSNLNQRYTDGVRAIRGGDFQNILNQYADSSLENIQAGMAEQITKSKQARQKYVEGLQKQ